MRMTSLQTAREEDDVEEEGEEELLEEHGWRGWT